MMKRTFLGFQLDIFNSNECVSVISLLIHNSRKSHPESFPKWLACLNPHSYAMALDDLDFASALQQADWLIPDGIGVVWAGRALGLSIPERITGYDIFSGVLKALDNSGGGTIFLLGSTEKVLDNIESRMARDYPKVRVSGRYSPPFLSIFPDSENNKMIELVNTSGADALFVSFSAPKQEKWIAKMHGRINVPFTAGIGAVFDFYSGSIRRSPLVFQRVGLEWLPRLVQEPRRLWRRMVISAPRFIWSVLLVFIARR